MASVAGELPKPSASAASPAAPRRRAAQPASAASDLVAPDAISPSCACLVFYQTDPGRWRDSQVRDSRPRCRRAVTMVAHFQQRRALYHHRILSTRASMSRMSLPLLPARSTAPAAAPASGATGEPRNTGAMVPSGSMRLLTERCTQLWRLASRAPVVAAVLSLALVLAQLAVHQDEGSWVAKGALYDTAQLEGHFVEWEWIHVGQTVSLVDGTSR